LLGVRGRHKGRGKRGRITVFSPGDYGALAAAFRRN
jgi:hypothetical protein